MSFKIPKKRIKKQIAVGEDTHKKLMVAKRVFKEKIGQSVTLDEIINMFVPNEDSISRYIKKHQEEV